MSFAEAHAVINNLTVAQPVSERVQIVQPIVQKLLAEFESNEMRDGVLTFQEKLMQLLEGAGLVDIKNVSVAKVGVHPCNRDGAGLVPVDVHDLLLHIVKNGWSHTAVDAMAIEIPPSVEGQTWREFNEQLCNESDGLIAAVDKEALEVVTVRGSHTTAAVRAMLAGCKGIHDEMCTHGKLSFSKISELQPSMQEPAAKGIVYKVVKHQLATACPTLATVLSRTGNALHGVHRHVTSLQMCWRLHAHAAASADPDWTKIVSQACIGMPPNYSKIATQLVDFVQAWSGGASGHILKELEKYERLMTMKRNLAANDLHHMGKLDALMDAPRYVAAMVKALLNAPDPMTHDGVACIFNNADWASLQRDGRSLKDAKEASRIMVEATNWLKAYANMAETDVVKLISDLEVRLVMHVHGKKTPSRKEFKNLLHIAQAFYDSAKALDCNLPRWSIIKEHVAAEKPIQQKRAKLREVAEDRVTDDVLHERGFIVGAKVTDSTAVEFTIMEVGDKVKLAAENNAEKLIDRATLLESWRKVVAAVENKVKDGKSLQARFQLDARARARARPAMQRANASYIRERRARTRDAQAL